MLWGCENCHTLFAVGLSCCPNCGGTDYTEDQEEMTRWHSPDPKPITPEKPSSSSGKAPKVEKPPVPPTPRSEQS